MKKRIAPVLFLLAGFTATAQTREIARNDFLEALNKLAAVVKVQHWAYEDPFTVDSAFHFIGDTLTATFKFATDSNYYHIRYAAPMKELKGVSQDMYLILLFRNKAVHVYEKIGNGTWNFSERRSMFHLGLLDDEDKKHRAVKDDVEWAVEELLEYYK